MKEGLTTPRQKMLNNSVHKVRPYFRFRCHQTWGEDGSMEPKEPKPNVPRKKISAIFRTHKPPIEKQAFFQNIQDLIWDGIRKRTLSLGFLGIILRVLRLEVSTLVFCLSTRFYSWTNFIDWLFCINFWNHRVGMVLCQVFLLCLHQ